MSQSSTSFMTTTPSKATTGRTNTFRTTPNTRPHITQDTLRNRLSQCCMHVHQPTSQVCKPGESLALRKVKHPHNGKTSVSRFPLTKQDILSQYSCCFEGIGRSQGIRTDFILSQTTSQQDMHQGKFQSILKQHLRRRSSL